MKQRRDRSVISNEYLVHVAIYRVFVIVKGFLIVQFSILVWNIK